MTTMALAERAAVRAIAMNAAASPAMTTTTAVAADLAAAHANATSVAASPATMTTTIAADRAAGGAVATIAAGSATRVGMPRRRGWAGDIDRDEWIGRASGVLTSVRET